MTKKKEENVSGIISIPKSKYDLIKNILKNIQDSLGTVLDVLNSDDQKIPDDLAGSLEGIAFKSKDLGRQLQESSGAKIIEGVFDGQKMISGDGQEYVVPPNYASKSKLVEGDILKLTITATGDFLFKQIGPLERQRLVGELLQDEEGNFYAKVDNKKWKLLTASVTYYRGEAGDQVVILVPKEAVSVWAAVENVIKH
jgi:hypothetical protein